MNAEPLTRGERIRHVRLALAGPTQDFVSQGRFGKLVAAEQGRPAPYDTSTAKRWEDGAPPELAAIEAMVRLARRYGLLYITRAWLAFGDEAVAEAINAPSVPRIERIVEKEEDDESTPSTRSGAPALPRRQVKPPPVIPMKHGRGKR